jgi:hypothetical protein
MRVTGGIKMLYPKNATWEAKREGVHYEVYKNDPRMPSKLFCGPGINIVLERRVR